MMAELVYQTAIVAAAPIVTPQATGEILVSVKAGQFRFKPKRDITAYQLAQIMRIGFACVSGSLRSWWVIDDLFAEVYAETVEHWEKV